MSNAAARPDKTPLEVAIERAHSTHRMYYMKRDAEYESEQKRREASISAMLHQGHWRPDGSGTGSMLNYRY